MKVILTAQEKTNITNMAVQKVINELVEGLVKERMAEIRKELDDLGDKEMLLEKVIRNYVTVPSIAIADTASSILVPKH